MLAEDDALAALPVAAAKKHKRPRMPRVATMIELMHAINKTVTAVTETPESVTLFLARRTMPPPASQTFSTLKPSGFAKSEARHDQG